MTYVVKELFLTLQGEGFHTGRPAVFCRFAGCNLWSGREVHRPTAVCSFCDTDFVGTDGVGGGVFASPDELADAVAARWLSEGSDRFVVCTGGEPLLQLDVPLVDALHAQGFEVAVETNGTLAAPCELDWVCVSPKAGASLAQRSGDELKVVVPQAGIDLHELAALDFDHFFVQPMDGPMRAAHTEEAVQWCLDHPRWRLSVQTHKFVGIP